MRLAPLRGVACALGGLGLLVAAVMLPGYQSRAATIYNYNGQPVAWPAVESVRYLSPSSFPPDSDAETLVLESMVLWNIVPGSDFLFYYARLDQDYPIDNYDGYCDTAAASADQFDPGVLAITFMVNDEAEWFDADLVFNADPEGVGFSLDPYPSCDVLSAPTPTNGFSFLLVSTHEMGHAVGLGHEPMEEHPPEEPWFVATMNPHYPAGGPIGHFNIVEVHADDRAGIRTLYPPASVPGTPVAELASASHAPGGVVGKVVPLSVTPSLVYPGEQISMRSVIENFGTTQENLVRQGFYLSDDPLIEVDDEFLGSLTWDLPVEEAFSFNAVIDLPPDMASGTYHVGGILDDLEQVTEEYEDNNAVAACDPLTIGQYPPAIQSLASGSIACGAAYVGPTPTVGFPLNMGPMTWELDVAPPAMTVNAGTGQVTWPEPVPSTNAYTVTLRATNDAGNDTVSWSIVVPIGDLNADSDVTLSDLALLQACQTGPASTPPMGCGCADADVDNDIDLRDLQAFQQTFGR